METVFKNLVYFQPNHCWLYLPISNAHVTIFQVLMEKLYYSKCLLTTYCICSWEMYFMDFYQGNNFFSLIMQNIPCLLYSVAIIVADFLYRHLAEYLTLQGL